MIEQQKVGNRWREGVNAFPSFLTQEPLFTSSSSSSSAPVFPCFSFLWKGGGMMLAWNSSNKKAFLFFFIKILRFITRKLSLYATYICLLYNIKWCVVRLSRDFWWISLPRGLLLFSPPPLPLCVFPFFEMQGGGKRMVGHWPHSCRFQSQRKALIKSAKRPRANFSIGIVCFCGKYGLCVDGQAIKKARQIYKKYF